MKKVVLFFPLLFALAVNAFATHVAVLETIATSDVKDKVTLSDRRYMTDVLREEAVKQLPSVQNYTIMTRENIQQMLPPGKSIEDCEGTCLVETGKNIAANYVCQARVGTFGGKLTLSAELYETDGNKLVASFTGQEDDVGKLLVIIKQNAPDFFRRIKGNSTGFSDVGGIGDVSGADGYSYTGKKKYIVEVSSDPAGALPTIDGKGIPKCLSTPCKIQVEEGRHIFVLSKDRYEDAESQVDINENNQKIELKLLPNFGTLELAPVFEGNAGSKGSLEVLIDGKKTYGRKVFLDPGLHHVKLRHPCYDPVDFNVKIVKNQTELFNNSIARGKGGLELNAEYNGVPQDVSVYIDGVKKGSTPYSGEVPLCADIELRGDGWSETVYVTPKWHEVVQETVELRNILDDVDESTEATSVETNVAEDETKTKANAAYDELDGKSGPVTGESVPANVKKWDRAVVGKIVLGASAAVAVTGVVLAIVGENKAMDAADRGGKTVSELEKNRDDAEFGQTLRSIGLGLMLVGTIGVGVSFAF